MSNKPKKAITKKQQNDFEKRATQSLIFDGFCPETIEDLKEEEALYFTPEALRQEMEMQEIFNDFMMMAMTRMLAVHTADPDATIRIHTAEEEYGHYNVDEFVFGIGKKVFSVNKMLFAFQEMLSKPDAKNERKTRIDNQLAMIQNYKRLMNGDIIIQMKK